jgi:polyphenol oxidase
MHSDWLRPEWSSVKGVAGMMTTRAGGCSVAPWDSMNVGIAVEDDPQCVARNRAALRLAIGAIPVFMKQVHGTRVTYLTQADAQPDAPQQEADACITTEPNLACTVQVADCLPVLFAASNSNAVGAAHAGWRGLAGGVLEATLKAVCEAAGSPPEQIQCWMGACIGPQNFEVGDDVRQVFGVTSDDAGFAPTSRPGKWLADLPLLARRRLQAAGVQRIDGGRWCTVADPQRFFSFRRDRLTGRMACAVWIQR